MHEPLVMIPGLMSDARLFLPQMVRLGAERHCHVCIAAQGETVEQMSEALMAGLRGRISGTLLPTYVLDIPGGYGKVPLVRDHAEPLGGGRWRITDWRGGVHDYRDPVR